MEILVVGRGIPNEEYPLNGIFEFDQAKALAGLGHKTIYLALDLRSIRRKRKWGIHKYEAQGINVIEANIPCGNIPKDWLIKIGELVLEKILVKEIDVNKIDIVHAHFADMSIITSRVIKKFHKKLVITEHSSEITKMQMDKKRYETIKKAYQTADRLIAVSSAFCRHIKKEFGVDSVCVNNIVDKDAFKIKEDNKISGPFKFVVTGRLSEEKRIDLLLDALAQVVEKNKNIFLYVIGDGGKRQSLLEIVEKKKLENHVTFCGKLQREEINEIYKECQCFVLPSVSETFGVAYIEALTSGLPVIATKCGGPEDFVNDENGILIEVNDKEALVGAMESMIEKYHQYDYKKISRDILKQFSPEVIGKELLLIYEEVLGD